MSLKIQENKKVDLGLFHDRILQIPRVLKELGFEDFKNDGQKRTVQNLLNGKSTICVIPTSGGKTACHIIPALCADWKVLIFSPLKALMQDQVESMRRLRLRAASVHSGQTQAENSFILSQWAAGDVQFLLVAPERMDSNQFNQVMDKRSPDLVVIDEAHVGSEWSDSFRMDYARIGQLIERLNPSCALAMTATAPRNVMADIKRIYHMENALVVSDIKPRENLFFSSRGSEFSPKHFQELIINPGRMPAIVYCATRRKVEELYSLFSSSGYPVGMYHGGMTDPIRQATMHDFMRGDIGIMFATNAFGMGIDKADIRAIIHAQAPPSLENLQQETGRAGRDGKHSECVLFYDESSVNVHMFLTSLTYPADNIVGAVLKTMRDRSGDGRSILRIPLSNIADSLRVPEGAVSSACNLLDSQGFLRRVKETSKAYVFSRVQKDRFNQSNAMDAYILSRGTPHPREVGAIIVDAEGLQKAAKSKRIGDLQTLLRQRERAGDFMVQFPFNGVSTIVTPTELAPRNVDTSEWEHRRTIAVRKLDEVRQYHQTPDAYKQKFLQDYFSGSA